MLPLLTMEGRVAAEPELRFTPGGKAVCELALVANDRVKQGDGSWADGEAFWLRATCWEQLAENVVNSVEKGDLVVAIGKVYTDEYEDKEGNKRRQTRMKAYSVSVPLRFAEAKVQRIKREAAPESTRETPVPPQDDTPPF
jgi:single-strand DNA-binding protein